MDDSPQTHDLRTLRELIRKIQQQLPGVAPEPPHLKALADDFGEVWICINRIEVDQERARLRHEALLKLLPLTLGALLLGLLIWRLSAPLPSGLPIREPSTPPVQTSAGAPSACPPVADALVDIMARTRQRELGASGNAKGVATLSIALLRDVVAGLREMGTVGAETASSLLKDLEQEAVKRGGEITTDLAKALIDRYVRTPTDKPAQPVGAPVSPSSLVNVYCAAPPLARPAPSPSRPRPAPCESRQTSQACASVMKTSIPASAASGDAR